MPKRSITDTEIGLIKAMLARGMANNAIQFYFNRQDRPVNSGRITGIRQRSYGSEVARASDEQLAEFLESFSTEEPSVNVVKIEGGTPATLDPVDQNHLRSFFRKDETGRWFCTKGESAEYECKENFNIRNFSKPLKTIAGFANNVGGYLFFGVKDLPHAFEVCGLPDDRFSETDQNKFSQTIRSTLAPTPRFRVTTVKLGELSVGVIHIEAHSSKPVIASKNEGDVAEGSIYYRYPGETKAISYADLRAILDERDLRSREAILPMVQRLLELGPKDALVANLADGQLEGGGRPILIDPASLAQIKFIKEGEFDEVEGAPTLRVLGDAQAVSSDILMPVRTVREEVTVDAILRNFVNSTPVEQPLSYFRQVSHEAGWTLPIFYYLHLAGQSRLEAANTLKTSKLAKPKARAELVKLLNRKRTLHSKLGGKRRAMFELVCQTPPAVISSAGEAKEICSALMGMSEDDSDSFPVFHDLLRLALNVWEAGDGDRELLGYIRRAAARLDEVEYGPLVPSS